MNCGIKTEMIKRSISSFTVKASADLKLYFTESLLFSTFYNRLTLLIKSQQGEPMKQTLHLYKNNSSTWLFDDPEKDITAEPFVEGSSELITEVQSRAGFAGDTLSITFSDESFPESQYTLLWQASSTLYNLKLRI